MTQKRQAKQITMEKMACLANGSTALCLKYSSLLYLMHGVGKVDENIMANEYTFTLEGERMNPDA